MGTLLRIDERRRAWLVLGLAFWMMIASVMLSQGAAAQDTGKESSSQSQPVKRQSDISWFLESSGFIGIVILLLSMYFIATVGKLFFELRHEVAMPPQFVKECEELLGKKDFMALYNKLKGDSTFFGRLLYTGISELPNGFSEARESMQGVGEAITVGMEKKISMLAVLGTLGPMIGLLGTLQGMIQSFKVIATSDVQLKAGDVAKGISSALVLTFEGVALSVPAIYFFAIFRNRVSTISVDTVLKADEFLRHFGHATRKKAAAAPVAAGTTAS